MLKWQTVVYAGATALTCLESYDSIHDRIRQGEVKTGDTGFTWMPPVELTVKGTDGPMRALVQPSAISAVVEIPESEREPLEDA